MYQPFKRILPETKELMARIAAAAPGDLGYELSAFPDKVGFEQAIYSTTNRDFYVRVHKVLQPSNSSVYTNELFVRFVSESIRQQNARCGITALNSSSAMAVEYHVLEKPNIELKARMAMEMDRSCIPGLQELARQFVAELKGDAPVPPLSSKAYAYLGDMQPVPVG